MNKKLLGLAFALLFVSFSFNGCGSNKVETPKNSYDQSAVDRQNNMMNKAAAELDEATK